jgi:hypothetical protein
MIILTSCAHCAAPLEIMGKKCGRCFTRYCGADCQKAHWKAGHKQMCPQIRLGGGAEKYNADRKYAEAVETAFWACKEETKGQTCYICMEEFKSVTNEGLVNNFCACRGGSSYAHVSCVATQARVVVDDETSHESAESRWNRWNACRLCGQRYHGRMQWALGWACWQTYTCRDAVEYNWQRLCAMGVLGRGLKARGVCRMEEALVVQKAEIATHQLLYPDSLGHRLGLMHNVAGTLMNLGQRDKALELHREICGPAGLAAAFGATHEHTLRSKLSLSSALIACGRGEKPQYSVKPQLLREARSLTEEYIPVVDRVLGPDHECSLQLRENRVEAIMNDTSSTPGDRAEAKAVCEDATRRARRVFGASHPMTVRLGQQSKSVAKFLTALEQAGSK